jgi:excisionase family DNA binding protein
VGEFFLVSQLHTVNESCERLRISRDTLYQLIRTGELPTVKIGKRRFVTATALDEFIENHTTVAGDAA